MQHRIQQIDNNYVCTVCQWKWDSPPEEDCPGVLRYAYGKVPENLVSLTELKRRKLKPGGDGKPVGVYKRIRRPYAWLYFYDVEQARPRRVPTARQTAAITKARATLIARHTCDRCGWYDTSRGRGRHLDRFIIDDMGTSLCNDCVDYLAWIEERHEIEQDLATWFRSETPPFLVLDTETIGLADHPLFQVVEIVAIDQNGNTLFSSLIQPDTSIPLSSTKFHGLTDEDLINAPPFPAVWLDLIKLLLTHKIWAYNAAFDLQAILATARRYHLAIPPMFEQSSEWYCLMETFARYYGESSKKRKNYYKGLTTACEVMNVPRGQCHRAKEDALAALRVMRALAERNGTSPSPEARPIHSAWVDDGY